MLDNYTERLKIASTILTEVQETARQYAVAIAGMDSYAEGTVQGTGTIVEFGGRVLLITAEHVVSQIEKRGFSGIAFSNGNNKPFSKVLLPFERNTAIDIAFVAIPRPEPPDSDRRACPDHLLALSSVLAEKDLLFVYGFPGDDSKYWALLKGIRSKTLTFAAYPGTSRDSAFDSAAHLALRYEPRHCIGIDGKEANLPLPHGLSGTAVWSIPRREHEGTWAPADARIVGIAQKWDADGQCLIATRIDQVLQFLRSVPGDV